MKSNSPNPIALCSFILLLFIASCNTNNMQKTVPSAKTEEEVKTKPHFIELRQDIDSESKEGTKEIKTGSAPTEDFQSIEENEISKTPMPMEKVNTDEHSMRATNRSDSRTLSTICISEARPTSPKHEISTTSWKDAEDKASGKATYKDGSSTDMEKRETKAHDRKFEADYIGVRKETKAVTVEGAAPSSGSKVNVDLAGKLTAGEINDFQKWKMWEDIADSELKAYREIWRMNPSGRYTVIVQSEKNSPIIDCTLELVAKNGDIIWSTKTDNTGKGELWNHFDNEVTEQKADFIRVKYDGHTQKIERPKTIDRGVNTFKLPSACDIPEAVDILFTVDATGSMGDEISYLQAELVDVINKVKSKYKNVQLRLGSVFYRDHGDTYVTRKSAFNSDVNVTNDFIAQQYADGGGDGPEAVDAALAESIDNLSWSARARTRLMFLVLDAPPHADKAFIDKMNLYVKRAAEKGIRIIPLVASGGGYDQDKSLEYLMRCCALGTNGTYAFLTDHSGIGGTHTAPSTDKYEVETLNALLLRIIDQYLFVPDCNVQEFINTQEVSDTTSVSALFPAIQSDSLQNTIDPITPITSGIFTLKCYPNPATDYVWAETSEQVKEIFLADNSGKIIQRFTPTTTLVRIELNDYPTGVYFLKAWINEKWASARIVVARL